MLASHYSLAFSIRTVGDLCLLLSFPTALFVVRRAGSAAVSLQTQALFLFTFLLRYTDLAGNWRHHMLYHFIFKCVYIVSATVNVALLSAIKVRVNRTCTWPKIMIPIIIVSAILAIPLRYRVENSWWEDVREFGWAWSEYMGGLSVLPQLLLCWTNRFNNDDSFDGEEGGPRRVHKSMFAFLYLLLAHQSLYIVNWVARYFEEKMVDPISIASGVFRLTSIAVFLIRYAQKDPEGQVRLPGS